MKEVGHLGPLAHLPPVAERCDFDSCLDQPCSSFGDTFHRVSLPLGMMACSGWPLALLHKKDRPIVCHDSCRRQTCFRPGCSAVGSWAPGVFPDDARAVNGCLPHACKGVKENYPLLCQVGMRVYDAKGRVLPDLLKRLGVRPQSCDGLFGADPPAKQRQIHSHARIRGGHQSRPRDLPLIPCPVGVSYAWTR